MTSSSGDVSGEEPSIAIRGQGRDERGAGDRVTSGFTGPHEDKAVAELQTAAILVTYLNQLGAMQEWLEPSAPVGQEGGVDAVALPGSGSGVPFNIQVTTPERIAQRMTDDGLIDYEREAPLAHWVSGLVDAIMRKQYNSKSGIVLTIDARQPAALADAAVVRLFRQSHGAWAATFGYDDIYVVGPDASMVARLTAHPNSTEDDRDSNVRES
jgi:hypothetical protein